MNTLPPELWVFIVSALPVGELRAGIPLGLSLGLDPWVVFWLAVLGNLAPVIPILLFLEPTSNWLMTHSKIFNRLLGGLFEKTRQKHSDKIEKYGAIALVAFVAIPSPGTGAWTGSLVAWLFGIKLKYALAPITAGVLIAGILVMAISTGALTLFRFLENPLISLGLFAATILIAVLIIRYGKRKKDKADQ